MLDENYTGGNFDGGFNGYNSMQKGEYFQQMNDSRGGASSPRNNFLMRTYDSMAMTQQFNYGFNYNTSGGGAEVVSHYSNAGASLVDKTGVNES